MFFRSFDPRALVAVAVLFGVVACGEDDSTGRPVPADAEGDVAADSAEGDSGGEEDAADGAHDDADAAPTDTDADRTDDAVDSSDDTADDPPLEIRDVPLPDDTDGDADEDPPHDAQDGAADAPHDAVDDADDAADGRDDDADDAGGTPEWQVCAAPPDCVLRAAGCCSPCGMPTVEDLDGVHRDKVDAHFDAVCDEDPPMCPRCPEALNPWLVATCASSRCEAVDLRRHEVTACDEDSDCRMNVPRCCECGPDPGSHEVIAMNAGKWDLFRELMCAPDGGCAGCVPRYPSDVEAFCADDGHCDVRPVD